MAFAILLLFAVVAQVSAAGSAPGAARQPVTAAPVTMTLRLTDQRRQFRPGEVIPFALEFNSATTARYLVDGATYDRSGRLMIDDFAIDRIDDVSDPMLDYFGSSGGHIGGGIRGNGVLGERPFTVKLELNEWFRFDTPGSYTLAVTSHRVTDESVRPPVVIPIESNPVSFEVLPRSAAGRRRNSTRRGEVTRSSRSSTPRRLSHHAVSRHREAVINGPPLRCGSRARAATDWPGRLFGGEPAGLFGAGSRLRAADQPVTGNMRTLDAVRVPQHPEFRPPRRGNKGRLVTGGELSRRSDLIDAASACGDIVTAALPDKTGALAVRAGGSAVMDAVNRHPAAARDQLAASFSISRSTVKPRCSSQWRTLKGPAMLPALRRLAATPAAGTATVRDLALRRLVQLAPDEARPLVLREIQRPQPGATLKTLGSLPDAELPNLDEALAANFEANDDEIHAALVERYATRKIAARILAAAGDEIGRMACRQQASILAYFLRVDEAAAATLLDRAMASRATGCRTSLDQIADLRMTPMVQARAIADLDHPDPEAVIAAIQTLGQHGSPAALEPLRAAFQRWHVTWDGRGSELEYSRTVERPHARQATVEDAFRQAIGFGRNWLVRATELRDLQSLCVTENCRTQTGYMIHEDDTRIMVWSIDEPDRSHLELAQYRFMSVAALKEKLARYPRGTSLTLERLATESGDVTAAIAEIVTFAASRGLTIKAR